MRMRRACMWHAIWLLSQHNQIPLPLLWVGSGHETTTTFAQAHSLALIYGHSQAHGRSPLTRLWAWHHHFSLHEITCLYIAFPFITFILLLCVYVAVYPLHWGQSFMSFSVSPYQPSFAYYTSVIYLHPLCKSGWEGHRKWWPPLEGILLYISLVRPHDGLNMQLLLLSQLHALLV